MWRTCSPGKFKKTKTQSVRKQHTNDERRTVCWNVIPPNSYSIKKIICTIEKWKSLKKHLEIARARQQVYRLHTLHVFFFNFNNNSSPSLEEEQVFFFFQCVLNLASAKPGIFAAAVVVVVAVDIETKSLHQINQEFQYVWNWCLVSRGKVSRKKTFF